MIFCEIKVHELPEEQLVLNNLLHENYYLIVLYVYVYELVEGKTAR